MIKTLIIISIGMLVVTNGKPSDLLDTCEDHELLEAPSFDITPNYYCY